MEERLAAFRESPVDDLGGEPEDCDADTCHADDPMTDGAGE